MKRLKNGLRAVSAIDLILIPVLTLLVTEAGQCLSSGLVVAWLTALPLFTEGVAAQVRRVSWH